MRKIEKIISVEILSYNELVEVEKTLLNNACRARTKAQAPYSHYWVGCSVIVSHHNKNGWPRYFFSGCNVENVNWSETVHAEENAITTAVAKLGPCRILGIAVVGAPENIKAVWPPTKIIGTRIQNVSQVCPSCGHCLQVIAENCFDLNGKFNPGVPLLGYEPETGEIYRTTIGDAFPMPFLPQHLGVNYAQDHRIFKRKN